MHNRHRLVAIGLTLAVSRLAIGGEFNKGLNIGDPAPSWSGLEGVDGKRHSLADLKDAEAVVVVFTCNSCPIATDYEDRIIDFVKKQKRTGQKVALVAINVNTIPDDRLDRMTERAKDRGFPFPYLYDPTQKTARAYGAMYTPEFFVLDKDRKVAYMGAMDDRNKEADAKVSFLDLAVTSVLKGAKPVKTETLPRGCRIRFDRARS